jgi:hypothetical protein
MARGRRRVPRIRHRFAIAYRKAGRILEIVGLEWVSLPDPGDVQTSRSFVDRAKSLSRYPA